MTTLSKLVALVLSFFAILVLTACSTEEPPCCGNPCEPLAGLVLVVGVHQNQPAPDITPDISCRLQETIRAGRPVGVIAVDGAPWPLVTPQVFDISGANPTVVEGKVVAAYNLIVGSIQSAAPRTNGSDLVAGLNLATDAADTARPEIEAIIVIDSAVPDLGAGAMTEPGMTVAAPEEFAHHLQLTGAFNASTFADRTVEFWSIGSTAAPQDPFSQGEKDNISLMWIAAVERAGGTATAVPYPRDGEGPKTQFTTTPIAVHIDRPMTPGVGAEYSFDGASALGFESNKSVLLDEPAARKTLAPIAEWLADDLARHATITGRTSSANLALNVELSADRAALVGAILVELGAAQQQLTLIGAGYTASPPDRDAAGDLIPAAAALNRVTEITLGQL